MSVSLQRKLLAGLAAAALVGACATPDVVQERQAGDERLSCDQLLAEIQDAEDFEEEARDDRGVTGGNVAAALLFWPALAVTYANTEEAIDAAEDRQDHLRDLYREKGC